jgi:hypothetical protein
MPCIGANTVRKPIILITVCRRYHELRKNLEAVWEAAREFPCPPEVVVVWACPEVGRLWFFQELLAEGKIQHVVGRPRLSGESLAGPTTYPESHNLRRGLEFILDTYKENFFVIGQAADVRPTLSGYRDANQFMQTAGAFVCFWPNGCVHTDVWHTNFFGVCADEAYWPPVSGSGNADTLERQWGRQLADRHLPDVIKSHNANNRYFSHTHESEGLEEFPFLPQSDANEVSCFITGRKSRLRRFLEWLGVVSVK